MGGRQQALALLRLAGLGIEDVVIDERELLNAETGEVRRDQTLSLMHRSSGRLAELLEIFHDPAINPLGA